MSYMVDEGLKLRMDPRNNVSSLKDRESILVLSVENQASASESCALSEVDSYFFVSIS